MAAGQRAVPARSPPAVRHLPASPPPAPRPDMRSLAMPRRHAFRRTNPVAGPRTDLRPSLERGPLQRVRGQARGFHGSGRSDEARRSYTADPCGRTEGGGDARGLGAQRTPPIPAHGPTGRRSRTGTGRGRASERAELAESEPADRTPPAAVDMSHTSKVPRAVSDTPPRGRARTGCPTLDRTVRERHG